MESSRPKGRGEKGLFDMVDEGGKDDDEEEEKERDIVCWKFHPTVETVVEEKIQTWNRLTSFLIWE